MSRSFIVNTEHNPHLTLKDFMNSLKNLTPFDMDSLKIFHNRQEIHSDCFDKISLNTGLTVLMIDDVRTYINCHGDDVEKNKFWWYIESRALEGRGRSLFVASACIIANLTDGLANSADGAWNHNPDQYYDGSALWKEYLHIEMK